MESDTTFQIARLGDLGEFKNGANFSQDDYGLGFPIINVKQLYSGRYVSTEDLESLKTGVLKRPEALFVAQGDILFARSSVKRSGAGQCALVPTGIEQTVFSGFIIRFRLSERSRADASFLAYALGSPIYREVFQRIATGTTISNLSQAALGSIEISLPPLEHQIAISKVLGLLDDRIDLLRQTNATLEAIAQALFKSWFVDFDPVHAKAEGREPEAMDTATAALFPSEFEESELSPIPKGWRSALSGTIYEVGIGKTPPRKEPHWFTKNAADIAWASIRDMGAAGVFLTRTSEFLTREAVEKFNVRTVPEGSVLMSFKLTVGRLAIADCDMTTNEAIAHFKPKQGSLPQSFLYCFLKSFDMHSLGSTSSIANATNSKAIRNIPILHPDLELAQKFDALAGPLLERIRIQQRQMLTLESLRDTLLPRLISGKLRLPDATKFAEEAIA